MKKTFILMILIICGLCFGLTQVRHWHPDLFLEKVAAGAVRASGPVKVKALNQARNAVQGATVNFSIIEAPANASGHSVTPATVITGADGYAEATFESGLVQGIYKVKATPQGADFDESDVIIFTFAYGGVGSLFVEGFDRVVNNDKYAFITPQAQLPSLSMRYTGDTGNATSLDISLKTDYHKTVNGITVRQETETYTPSPFPINQIIMFSDIVNGEFRGGEMTLTYKLNNQAIAQEYKFYVRGYNPSKSAVYAYAENNFPASYTPWFYKKLMVHESGSGNVSEMLQFNIGGTVSPSPSSIAALPNWGYPDGWGIMQLDYSGSGTTTAEKCLWNWKNNVEKGLDILNDKFTATSTSEIGRGAEQFWNDQVTQYNAYCTALPDENVASPDITQYSNVTFSYDLEEGKSYQDAIWIKMYNGASPNYLSFNYRIIGENQFEPGSGYWAFHRTNADGIDYVQSICYANGSSN